MNQALEESIKIWKRKARQLERMVRHYPVQLLPSRRFTFVVGARIFRYGGEHCPLCMTLKSCLKCPVRIKTLRSRCENTPWRDVIESMECNYFVTPEVVKAHWDEVRFLESLREVDNESVA